MTTDVSYVEIKKWHRVPLGGVIPPNMPFYFKWPDGTGKGPWTFSFGLTVKESFPPTYTETPIKVDRGV